MTAGTDNGPRDGSSTIVCGCRRTFDKESRSVEPSLGRQVSYGGDRCRRVAALHAGRLPWVLLRRSAEVSRRRSHLAAGAVAGRGRGVRWAVRGADRGLSRTLRPGQCRGRAAFGGRAAPGCSGDLDRVRDGGRLHRGAGELGVGRRAGGRRTSGRAGVAVRPAAARGTGPYASLRRAGSPAALWNHTSRCGTLLPRGDPSVSKPVDRHDRAHGGGR